MKKILPVLALTLLASPAAARPVLLELFTSQSCSSCPPAEALLARMKAARPDIVALEWHVDYWNALSWRDPYSSRASTNRQRDYARALGTEVFTPQLVIDGRRSEIGSDSAGIETGIASAQQAQAPGPSLSVSPPGQEVSATLGEGHGAGTLLLVGYDPTHTTAIPSGENGGTVLTEVNVVRSLQQIGHWQGAPLSVTAPRPQGQLYAVILQAADGTILACAFPPSS